jgi:hypothetical protein
MEPDAMDANTHAASPPPAGALSDHLREAKLSCESTAIILDVALMGRDGRGRPDGEELGNLRDTADRTIAALRQLLAVLPPR